LCGADISKNSFLKEFNDFECFLNSSMNIYEISEQTLKDLSELDVGAIYEKKYKNLQYLYSYYEENKKIRKFKNNCYFSFFISFENYVFVRTQLINNNIYPIILWPNYEGDVHLINGELLVSLHADFRYDLADLKKLTIILDGIFCEI
jgi:hypothetical protein